MVFKGQWYSCSFKNLFFFNGFVFLLTFILYWSIVDQKCFARQVYSQVIQLYMYMHLFIFKFFCHLGCYINFFILIHTFFFRATWRKRSETWTRWLLVNICPRVNVNCATCWLKNHISHQPKKIKKKKNRTTNLMAFLSLSCHIASLDCFSQFIQDDLLFLDGHYVL